MKGIIVAYDLEGGIGKNNELPWEVGDIKDDMARFRRITMGAAGLRGDGHNSVIYGRNTFLSLPESYRPLPGRQNIVLSRQALQQTVTIDGVEWADSLESAYAMADGEETWVIGGAEVFKHALPTVDVVEATRVFKARNDADTFFPLLDLTDKWDLVDEIPFEKNDRNKFGGVFSTYRRK